MAKIFITGSGDGLGRMAAQLLVAGGHAVVLHGRSEQRAAEALAAVPGAAGAVSGDLSSIRETMEIAGKVNALGAFDAVIHNAGVGYREPRRVGTVDGLPTVFAVNALAPYILTCLIRRPKRLIYLSSGLHREGDASLQDMDWVKRPWNGYSAYSDSKLYDVVLALALSRRWPDVLSNAVHPGWVATKMGGRGAPDSLEEGPATQVWLASSDEPSALVTGKYFYHRRAEAAHPAAYKMEVQELLLENCRRFSGVGMP